MVAAVVVRCGMVKILKMAKMVKWIKITKLRCYCCITSGGTLRLARKESIWSGVR
jgi:hypothetical protein